MGAGKYKHVTLQSINIINRTIKLNALEVPSNPNAALHQLAVILAVPDVTYVDFYPHVSKNIFRSLALIFSPLKRQSVYR